MDELQMIREALDLGHQLAEDHAFLGICAKTTEALAALSCLETLAAEMPDTSKIVWEIDRICNDPEHKAPNDSRVDEAGVLIGQYAYRYSEDIRKDRDYWQKTAIAFHDAVHQHIENHKGDKPIDLGGPSPVSKLATKLFSECQGCDGQGLDCAESCLRPR
jgi:hypothetical protein